MFSYKLCFYILLIAIFASCFAEQKSEENEISRGLNIKTLLEKITSTFMTRSDGSSSQVLSLNLTNLLILVLLKALIFAAGSIGASGWKGGHYGYGRSTYVESEDRFVSDTEILLFLGYLSGSPGKYQCLQNVACHRPQQAIQYAKAGGLLLKAAKIVPNIVDSESAHEKTLQDLRKAAEFGLSAGNCDERFICAQSKK